MLRNVILCTASLGLYGCSGVELDQYQTEEPQFVLEEYFNGEIEAWGMFQKRNGEVVKRFKVDIKATWEGNRGTLDERFHYSDGSKQRRVWKIIKQADGSYSGTADDVVGTATGKSSGNALQWNYTLSLPVDGKIYHVEFDDWMYLMEEEILLNRSAMKKFGFTLGEVILFFKKRS
jgi:hypothetical protein